MNDKNKIEKEEIISDLGRLLGLKRAYLGLQSSLEDSDIVVLPVPYDSTTSYGVGTRFGPAAIIDASTQVELYDIELGCNICDKLAVHTLDELAINKSDPAKTIALTSRAVDKIVRLGKKPVVFGGEHSIASGVVDGLKATTDLSKLSILQFDAHSDLRDSYEGTKYSHASAMRRVRELVDGPVTQVGIRSMCDEEAEFIKNEKLNKSIFYAHDLNAGRNGFALSKKDVRSIVDSLGQSEKVYVTFDIDCLDQSIVPGTGAPEPGGLFWQDVLSIMKEVGKQKEIVGFDINEVQPTPPLRVTEFIAAKLAYKMMGYFWL